MQEEIKQKFTTDSGIEIKETYMASDGGGELPGVFPYTRGIQKDMYRTRLWTMRQYAGFSTAAASNARYHYLIRQGTTGLSVAFDLPTQMGYDSDHVLSEGEVGKAGVAIDSLKDLEELFEGIQLDQITTSMTINSTAAILLCMYIALAKKQGLDIKKLSGTIQNDLLKEYVARGTYIYPPQASMRLITDIFEYCSKELPKWNTISVSGYHIREAGSTAVQELAFTLANGKAYLKAAAQKGLDINVFGQRISFFFNAHNNFFEEVAKFRAARRMWAVISQESGATEPKAQMLRFHAQTGGSTLTAQQPENNIPRVTLQALAAVLGGTQSLHTNGYDEAISLPSERAAGIALRTQQIIAFESGVTATVDPLAGSYFVEALTDAIEKAAWEYINIIDQKGGAVKAIEEGYLQKEIGDAANACQRDIESGEKIVVGQNKFFGNKEESIESIFTVDDSIRKVQIDKLFLLKKSRNNEEVNARLLQLEEKAGTQENLIHYILQAVESFATLGEISDSLRKVFGVY
jgi:methylmalonyl-CoA mutase N-terminal domain/subunit